MKKQKRNRGIVELKSRYGYMFTTHWIIGIVIFFALPLIQSVLFSFSKIEIVSGGIDFNLVGIENYKDIFGLILFGHVELFTEEMEKEYLKWCGTDEGKQYLKGGKYYEEQTGR